jgi:hypothetical protein
MIAPKGIIVCENADPVTTWFDWALMDFGRCIDFFLAETLGGQGSWRHRLARAGDLNHHGVALLSGAKFAAK